MIETKKQVEQALNMILKNDTKGLDILYNCMSKTMLFVAKSYIKDDLLAEDVVQDSFLDIVKNIKKYEKNFFFPIKEFTFVATTDKKTIFANH